MTPGALWDLVLNKPIETVDEDGRTEGYLLMTRRERWELLKPHWWYTVLARELQCGCTRRWWGTFTLFNAACEKHMGEPW